MTSKQTLELLHDMLQQYKDQENDFPVVDDTADLPEGYKGLFLHISDHGNVTLYRAYKNGNNKELAGIV